MTSVRNPLQGVLGDRVDGRVAGVAAVVVLAALPFALGEYGLSLVAYVLVYGLLAASLDLIWGYTGMLSFGHAVFFGLGGYAAAYLLRYATHSILAIVAVAFLVGALSAAVMIYPALRTETTGVYLAIITLIFSLLFEIAGIAFTEYTGGYTGISVTAWPALLPGVLSVDLSGTLTFYYVILAVVAVSTGLLRWVGNSAYGLVLKSIRENPERVSAIGYNPRRYQLAAAGLSGGFAAVAGGLFTPLNGLIFPQIFKFDLSGFAILYVLLGGRGTIFGAFVGTALIYVPKSYLTSLFPGVWMYAVGVLFIVLVLYLPEGLLDKLPGR